MMIGVVFISLSEAGQTEHAAGRAAMDRECERYGLDPTEIAATLRGEDPLAARAPGRRPWELALVAAAVAIFAWLAVGTQRQDLPIHAGWLAALSVTAVVILGVSGVLLWKRTRFS
jgi:hypothetical protein